MDRVKQASKDAQSAFQENIQPGKIGSLLLYFEGTNATATPGDFDDLGTVILKRNGETILNRPINVLADKANILKGSNLLDSTGSGAFKAAVVVPLYVKSFPQALEILGASELNFSWEPAAAQSTVFSALTLEVYSELTFLNEEYDYFLLGDDQTPGAAVDARPYQLNAENIASIFIRDPNDILTSAGLRQNGEQRFSDQPKEVLEAATLHYNNMEQTTTPMIEIQTYTEGQPRSLMNDSSILEITTSAGGNTISITREHIRLKGQGAGRLRR